MSSVQDPSDILPELLQTAFETLDGCHAALMQIQAPVDFLAQSEALWHQREHAIRQIGTFLAPENPLSESLKMLLMSRLEAFQKEDVRLQQHIRQFKHTLQQQRLANTAQLKAMQHYGR